MRSFTIILLPVVMWAVGPAVAAPHAQMRSLVDHIDDRCRELGIPGLAVVVVQDDEVVLEHCYGLADPARNLPVSPRTIFPVGSTSKPFTSTLTARLVSDGVLDWDDTITEYLPWFRLRIRSDDPGAEVLIRDLLSHRTGIFAMELIKQAVNWQMSPDFAPPFDREGILRAAVKIEPVADFREEHHYSNIGMIAVAEACARATGTSS
jgi:CubicO group peptidase (beta-lactamase class C family)